MYIGYMYFSVVSDTCVFVLFYPFSPFPWKQKPHPFVSEKLQDFQKTKEGKDCVCVWGEGVGSQDAHIIM